MRVLGSGMLAVGGALLVLLAIPFRQGRRWAASRPRSGPAAVSAANPALSPADTS